MSYHFDFDKADIVDVPLTKFVYVHKDARAFVGTFSRFEDFDVGERKVTKAKSSSKAPIMLIDVETFCYFDSVMM